MKMKQINSNNKGVSGCAGGVLVGQPQRKQMHLMTQFPTHTQRAAERQKLEQEKLLYGRRKSASRRECKKVPFALRFYAEAAAAN